MVDKLLEPPKPKGMRYLFCLEYHAQEKKNATQAAKDAGYSEKTCHSSGPRMLENVDVKKYLAWLGADRVKRLNVDADFILKRLTDELNADVADLYNEEGELKPVHEWPMVWRTGLVTGLDVENGKISKIKHSDRSKRIELAGKHIAVQAFNERKTIEVTIEDASDEELDDILDALSTPK